MGSHRWQRRAASATSAALLILVAVLSTPASADVATASQVALAMEDRAAFGLPTDAATLEALFAGADVGSPKWGIPLTREEEAILDLNGRMQFEASLDAVFLPFVRSLPEFAGVWIDQPNGGRVVVMLTDTRPDLTAAIQARLPAASRGLAIKSAPLAYADLLTAADEARAQFAVTLPSIAPVSVGIDTVGNRVKIAVASEDLGTAAAAADAISSHIGAPVSISTSPRGSDAACTTRESCYSPMKSGIIIHRGSTTSTWYCTMSWHIHVGSDEQFLTAGHCGYGTPNSWYHQGFVAVNGTGFVGNETATRYVNGGKDVMRVAILDSQASSQIYAQLHTGLLGPGSLPVVGEAVCASLGKTDNLDCGTVSDDWLSWTSETAGYTVWGGDTSGIGLIPGDSGSPLYKRIIIGDDIAIYPKGVMTHENGYFARITDALNELGATIVQ